MDAAFSHTHAVPLIGADAGLDARLYSNCQYEHGAPIVVETIRFGDPVHIQATISPIVHIPMAITGVIPIHNNTHLKLNHPLVAITLLDDEGHEVPGALSINGRVGERNPNGTFDADALARLSSDAGVRLFHLHDDLGGDFHNIAQHLSRDTLMTASRIADLHVVSDPDVRVTQARCTSLNVLVSLGLSGFRLRLG